jgi:hypothetical protein
MKDKNKAIKPEIGTFYLLTYDKTKHPWLPTEEVLFVKDNETFIKISISQGAGFSSRWDWATEKAVTITKLAKNQQLVDKLNLSVEIGRDIAKAELGK